ncbi:Ig-like domain-containing protein [Bacillus sp. FSL K6-3431]|uniref:Ig-like domain-containing protein n=1 Tax=Bacillus sp. FSL K6-3431 TaxID=2921500 RepID=UPI0030F8F647
MRHVKGKMTVLVAAILLMSTLLSGGGLYLADELSIDSVYFVDVEQLKYPENATIQSLPGENRYLEVKGTLMDGNETDLSEAKITLESSNPEVAIVDSEGTVKSMADGVAKITAVVISGEVRKSTSLFIQVRNPEKWLVDTALLHDKMTIEIGEPAILGAGDTIPSIQLDPHAEGSVTGELIRDGMVIQNLTETNLLEGSQEQLTFSGQVKESGHYEIHLEFSFSGQPILHDRFYFTVIDSSEIGGNESQVVYYGKDKKLEYVPDFKGNQILDFSNSGYKGGGVKIPNIQATVVIKPGEGDDTARIQEAIDQVSAMPILDNAFRGAVVLDKGTYEISGTLQIQASGVVLRGKGQAKDDTVLLATGIKKRNILEFKGLPLDPLENITTDITELFVPVGSRSFHVENPSAFQVGDEIIVRRYGNEHWIHEIDMDQIIPRPGADPDGTVQWSPFNLDFDRVITGIKGSIVTVDAPLANSIEERWGGGEIIKYDDYRIENVGVENLRVDTEFDPSVTKEQGGETYYADENHAQTFVKMDNVKNAWVRDVIGLHLSYSLVDVGKTSKWVTIQDTKSLDMVSVITGSRRYAYKYGGQLLLAQRVYAETARHAFLVDSRVAGPNVFLDSVSEKNYTTSEPHHRWSVGGLFDNVKAPISIQDRAWYGTGHGWSGANYVAWNTEGELTLQQPPTAQNYSIGHVGTVNLGDWPREGDLRPREQGYWESYGKHVKPKSLYLQQLEDRLGKQAVKNIKKTKVGGKKLDNPTTK